MFNKLYHRLKGSDFFRNLFTLLSGTIIGQFIITFTSIALMYIYTHEEIAIHTKFCSIATVVVVISSGRFDGAILLPKDDSDGRKLFRVSTYFILITSLLLTFIVAILPYSFYKEYNYQNIYSVRYLLPLWVGSYSLFYLLQQWHTRKHSFNKQKNAKITQGGVSSIFKVPIGLLYPKGLTLIVGDIASYIVSFNYLLKGLRFNFSFRKIRSDFRYSFKQFSNFFKYSLPMGLLNAISLNFIIYVLNSQFTYLYSEKEIDTIVASYGQAWKIINMPLGIITIAFSTIFYKKLRDSYDRVKVYRYSFFGNLLISTIFLLPFIFWGEDIFQLLFKGRWDLAGELTSYLVPLTIASFSMGSVSTVFSLTQKNEITLIWQIIYIAIAVLIIYLTKDIGYRTFILYFSLIGAIQYLILFVVGYHYLKNFNDTIDN